MHVCCTDAVFLSVVCVEHSDCTDSVHALIRQDFVVRKATTDVNSSQ